MLQVLLDGNCRYRQGFFTGLAGPRDDSPYAFNGSSGGDFGSDVKSISIHGATLQWIVSLSKPAECFFFVVAPVLETCQDDMNVVLKN